MLKALESGGPVLVYSALRPGPIPDLGIFWATLPNAHRIRALWVSLTFASLLTSPHPPTTLDPPNSS